jgi:membrane protease YdiL (CAAX protease family)
LQQTCGIIAVILLANYLKIRLFSRPECLIFIIPCLIIAIDNFPFWSYFSGNMQLILTNPTDVLLFSIYCLCIGLFEEIVFRGLLFYLLASYFSKDRKGLIKTFVYSSVIFGLAHLTNLFSGAGLPPTLLQVGYTTLTGGLFAFAFMKTKNVLFPACIHALYNFCGLILETPQKLGLGTGIVFDTGTVIMMAIISVIIGVFVLYSLTKYPENERKTLYNRLFSDNTEK